MEGCFLRCQPLVGLIVPLEKVLALIGFGLSDWREGGREGGRKGCSKANAHMHDWSENKITRYNTVIIALYPGLPTQLFSQLWKKHVESKHHVMSAILCQMTRERNKQNKVMSPEVHVTFHHVLSILSEREREAGQIKTVAVTEVKTAEKTRLRQW